MDNEVKKYSDFMDKLRNFYETKKSLSLGLIIGLILLIGLIGYFTLGMAKMSRGEFTKVMDESMAYLQESKTLKEQSLQNQISLEAFNNRSEEIQNEVKKINEKLHNAELNDVGIDRNTVDSLGNAIEGLVTVVLNSSSLDDLQDEILALSVILENMKEEDENI